MPYIPKIQPVNLTEDDVSELKTLLENIDQIEFQHGSERASLKRTLERIIEQIPRG